MRRNPALAAALGCVLVAVAAAGVFALQAHLEREQHRREQARSDREAERQREQHRREQIRQLVSQAYAAALDGRFDEAEAAVKEAELLGASTGVVRLLNGMITFHRGDPDGALDHLDQAVRLLRTGAGRGVADPRPQPPGVRSTGSTGGSRNISRRSIGS